MTYTGLELIMENLKHLSYSNGDPLINNPDILLERHQIKQLYKELSFMIQRLFVDKEDNFSEIEEVKDLKRRFKDLAQEAHIIVGLFVYSTNCRNVTRPPPPSRYDFGFLNCKLSLLLLRDTHNDCSLNLKKVMRALKSIKKESIMILDRLKMDSSPSIEPVEMQTAAAAGTSHSRNPLGMKKVLEEIVVGLDHDVELIRNKPVEDRKQLDVVSIVGMGGVGKTTLATKLFNDPYLVHHFHVRAWVTVSQTYEKQDLLTQILSFMDNELDLASASYSTIRGALHKRLMGRRYLIVIDDIWSNEAWDDLKMFFPNDHNGSRILLTSRLKEVASHAKSDGLIHQLECLTDEECWKLLCNRVFLDNDCPEFLVEHGVQIARNCHGLPLAVVVIAGVLAKEATLKDSWGRVAQRVSSYIVSDENGHVDILGLSYEHLPPHLKDCFLYLGGFPEDHKFRVRELIWLWVAEGFVQDGNRSLEEIGEDYMMELIDRNLVVVVDRKFNGAIKSCTVHDLLRELCLERAKKESFCEKFDYHFYHHVRQYRPRRIFTYLSLLSHNFSEQHSPWVQSLLFLRNDFFFIYNTEGYFHNYPLLKVLDLQKCLIINFPREIGLLVHLRYIAFCCIGEDFPSQVCNLSRSLLTIIARSYTDVHLPKAISNLVNLRHLWSDETIHFPSSETLTNLQTISDVVLVDEVESWEKRFPAIKKLTCATNTSKNDFESLNSVETLMWKFTGPEFPKIHVTFPASLKKLSLKGCCLPWSDMSVIQCLPNLEVLNILDLAFLGPIWETGEAQFQHLKKLKLQCLNIQQWEASSSNFPCLKHLVLYECKYLEEIPLEIGDISTLELIDIDDSSSSAIKSLDEIREEQQNFGNFELKINVRSNRWKHYGART